MQEINKFADITEDEFTKLYGLYERSKPVKYDTYRTLNETESTNNATDNIESLDWRDLGGFTPAKDQGLCGACYIFSVVSTQIYELFKPHIEMCIVFRQDLLVLVKIINISSISSF